MKGSGSTAALRPGRKTSLITRALERQAGVVCMAVAGSTQAGAGPKLKFCPESNDLLYPKEDRERRCLTYVCRNCGYTEDVPTSNWCVYRNEVTHTNKERTVILQDVRADPTLPRTRDVKCPECAHNEAVYFSASTEEGMTLFFNCVKCGHRWRDYV